MRQIVIDNAQVNVNPHPGERWGITTDNLNKRQNAPLEGQDDWSKLRQLINYRIYPRIMRTFFSQILPLKSRCALYTEPSVFMLGNLHNNTKSAKSNNSQFYATSRNKSRQKVCLVLYSTSTSVSGISHATCLRSRLKICCIFSSISMTK